MIALVSGAAGCVGNIGDGPKREAVPIDATTAVVISGARRLTRVEYDDTLRDLLHDTTRSGSTTLPEDATTPFDNDYTTQLCSGALIEAAEVLADEAAARAVADPSVLEAIVPCAPTGPDDSECLRKFIQTFGRKAFRRPLDDAEIDRYLGLQALAVEAGDFTFGVELVLRVLLQNPSFLYRIEVATPVADAPGVFRLGDYEVATRLSYFLLGTTPTDALLDLAGAGSLHTPEQVGAAAATLLEDPRARAHIERFHALWLGYDKLPSPDLATDMRQESAALVSRVIFEERSDYLDLFRSEETFVTDALAEHYDLPAPGSTEGAWVAYGSSPRRGILSHGTVLSAFAKFKDTSPTRRGKFVQNRLLCTEIPPPPPNVNVDEPPTSATSNCKADKYAAHAAGACKSCHGKMDPIGFGLERYDRSGKYREHDEGLPECPIRGDGVLDGVGQFNGPAELAELVISTGKLEPCVVRELYRFAIGRPDDGADEPILEHLTERFQASGNAFDQLLIDLVSSDSFVLRREDNGGK